MQHSYQIPGVRASVDLMFHPQGRLALLTRCEVGAEERGRGHASKLMRMMLADADREGITLYLTVEPDGTGLDSTALRSWYERLGFRDFREHTMIREPNTRSNHA